MIYKRTKLNPQLVNQNKKAKEQSTQRNGKQKERERQLDDADLALLSGRVKGGSVVPCGLPD